MKVYNLTSHNGNFVPNQFKIYHNNKVFFQSYDTIIAKIDGDKTILDTYALGYSRTTSKYLYKFLGYNKKEILQLIKNKSIILKNLNK